MYILPGSYLIKRITAHGLVHQEAVTWLHPARLHAVENALVPSVSTKRYLIQVPEQLFTDPVKKD